MIQELRREHDLTIFLEIAQLPRSIFYYHCKRQNKEGKYARAKTEISAIYHGNKGRYGYRRITDELNNCGIHLNHKTIQRFMKELGLFCRVRLKKYRSYKVETGEITDNELNREFRAETPNQKWVTSDSPNLAMVTTMLEQAFQQIPNDTGLILHSDQEGGTTNTSNTVECWRKKATSRA